MREDGKVSNLEDMIRSLDREKDQEDIVNRHKGSFFDQAPENDVLISRAREYDDVEKHVVRREYWLKIARELSERKGGAIRLLTLPGRYRFEIELYREAGLLGSYDPDVGLPVVGFESSPDIFGLLEAAQPRLQELFHGDLVDALINATSKHYAKLLQLFPFDIINLDLTSNLVAPSEGPYGPVLEAVRQCFRLQGGQATDWALLLTFRAVAEETNRDTIEKLTANYQANINRHPAVKEACYNKHGSVAARQILSANPADALGQFVAKWIVEQAHSFEFRMLDVAQLSYSRMRGPSTYSIRKLLFRFRRERIPKHSWPKEDLSWHINNIVDIVSARRQEDISEKLVKLKEKKPGYVDFLAQEVARLRSLFDGGLPSGLQAPSNGSE